MAAGCMITNPLHNDVILLLAPCIGSVAIMDK